MKLAFNAFRITTVIYMNGYRSVQRILTFIATNCTANVKYHADQLHIIG